MLLGKIYDRNVSYDYFFKRRGKLEIRLTDGRFDGFKATVTIPLNGTRVLTGFVHKCLTQHLKD